MVNTVLLNLSDLHFDNKKPVQGQVLKDFEAKLNGFIESHYDWKPDFVVLPGDIAENYDADNIKDLKEFLGKIKEACCLTDDEFIFCPGNHDKQYPQFKAIFVEELQRYYKSDIDILMKDKGDEEKERFKENAGHLFGKIEKFDKVNYEESIRLLAGNSIEVIDVNSDPRQKDMAKMFWDTLQERLREELKRQTDISLPFVNQLENSKKFFDIQKENFKGYSELVAPYSDRIESLDCFTDNKAACLTGYKFFPHENIAFLILNTEWFMFRSQFGRKPDPKLGHHIVIEITDKIMKEHPGCTVVTVMHRPPDSLGWEERNVKNRFQYNAYTRLINASDIILSGHDHKLNDFYPNYLNNKAQHFQLGSLSCPPDANEDVFAYSASFLKINAVCEEVALLTAISSTDGAKCEWNIDFKGVSAGVFPIKGKLESKDVPDMCRTDYGGVETLKMKWGGGDIAVECVKNEVLRTVMNRFYKDLPVDYRQWQYDIEEGKRLEIVALDDFRKREDDFWASDVQPDKQFNHIIVYSLDCADRECLIAIKKKWLLSPRLLDTILTPVMLLKHSEYLIYNK